VLEGGTMSETAANRSVTFTIDGRSFTLDDPHQVAADLLRLAGLDPTLYDLARMRPGKAEPQRFKDDQPVRIHEGNEFVSIRERAEVV
jgi:hypothetical protein